MQPQQSKTWEGTLDRLTAQNSSHMKVLLRHVYSETKEMSGARGPWCKMVLRFVDKEARGVYAEIRGSLESVQKAAAPWTKDVFFAADLKLVKHRYFAGHFLDLSEKGSKAKAHPVAQGHPQAMEMQKVFPIARSDFQVMEQQCQGRERADIVGVVTQLDLPPTSKPKANLWLKDLSGKEMLVNVWGRRHVDLLTNVQPGQVIQLDNCGLIMREDSSLEGTAEHFLDNDKHGFSALHVDPPGLRADKLRELGTDQGDRISKPWCPSLTGGGRLTSDMGPCVVACAATMNAFGSAMEQGATQDRRTQKTLNPEP